MLNQLIFKNWRWILPFVLLQACSASGPRSSIDGPQDWDAFSAHWYDGQAELCVYDLKQARYGELREGEAVLVFVTEPYSRSKHLKLSYPDKAGRDNVSVLKLNRTVNFMTGIYPYSLMSSSFTPIDLTQDPNSLKVTTTVQEWCGQTFTEIDLKGNEFEIELNSYFESEGIQVHDLPLVFLEDEIPNRIRINPNSLPTGHFEILEGSFYQRYTHNTIKTKQVEASFGELHSDDHPAELSAKGQVSIYRVFYSEDDRSLSFFFDPNFPYTIYGWTDEYTDGGKRLKSEAWLRNSRRTPYWGQNSSAHDGLRDSLGMRLRIDR